MSAQSVQDQVLDAVVALLGDEAGSAYNCRMEAFDAADMPAENVLPESEEGTYADTSSIDCRFRFVVRHTAQASDRVNKVVDGRYVRSQQAILADPTLGGLVRFTRYLGRKWEFEKGEVDTVALAVMYEVEFSTNRADPGLPGI